MLQDFNNVLNFSVSPLDVFINLMTALLCGLLVAFFYRKSYHGPGYSSTFINTLVILAMITSVVMMVIGNNLARAFGLVGAMSIVRFRTAVKDTQDIVFIFFALAIGMAAGVGYYAIALVSTIVIGISAVLLSKSLVTYSRREFLLQFSYDDSDEMNGGTPYVAVLQDFCRKYKIINTKSINGGGALELSYYVDLKNVRRNAEFIKELRRLQGVSNVNLYFDDEYF
jgi:uncharacterized membrane protein YhiD involved in acid resistance